MAPSPPRLRILSVGGNSVSAFLSWRLQATNACDVTLVWKSGFETVSQYGISFKSKVFGNERFKPLHVVRAPEEAAGRRAGFDYVILCVKALPDVYDLAAIIESVVTPQHTCILVNTTNSIGIEAHLEERFPTNVVLSLVSGAEIVQLGPSEFEHVGATDIWVGPANHNPTIPAPIQADMAEALAMTLNTGQVDCKVSANIRQQQFERMIGPIAFHPLSVVFETPSHADLMEKTGVRTMVGDIIDELLTVAQAEGCVFPEDFKESTIESMLKPNDNHSIMYQDFTARRPLEIETYLASPVKLAEQAAVRVPRLETIYAILHNLNILNQNRPQESSLPTASPAANPPPPRTSSASYGRPPPNGLPNGLPNGTPRGRGPPGPRRGGGMPNGFNGRGPPPGPNGYGRPPTSLSRRPSFDNNDLEEFSHVVLYDDIPEGGVAGYDMGSSAQEMALRERELMLRQREIELREQQMSMRRGPRRHGGRRGGYDDDDDDDDYPDPMMPHGSVPTIDPDNFDMLSVTSRRNRKAPSAGQLRRNPELMAGGGGGGGGRSGSFMGGFGRPFPSRNRSSQQLMSDVPFAGDNILDNPMMGYSSNRYGTVDRKQMHEESRTNSLTRERLDQLQGGGGGGMSGPYPGPPPRRTSMSPGDPFHPGRRTSGRPSPPNGDHFGSPGAYSVSGRGGGPGPMRQPVPRHPPGQGNAVAPQQVEQQAGMGSLPPPPPPAHGMAPRPPPKGAASLQVRSVTGSASASAGSGESGLIDSENSAHSSQSSFAPRPPIGVR